MSDVPTRVAINEEGQREGFQIEGAGIATDDKVRLMDLLSDTGDAPVSAYRRRHSSSGVPRSALTPSGALE